MNRRYKILVVDDDRHTLEVCAASLEHRGYEVTSAAGAAAAAKALRQHVYDLVITDYRLRGLQDFGIFRQVRSHSPNTRVIIVTAHHDADAVVQALRMGVDDYIFKPYHLRQLWDRIDHHLRVVVTESQPTVTGGHAAAFNEEMLSSLWIMTHDIRESLTSLSASLSALSENMPERMDDDPLARLRDLHDQGKRLIERAEELMSKSTSAESAMEVERETMDLREDVLDPVLDELGTELRESCIAVDNQVDVLPTNHIPVKGDRTWLRTVFRNLLKSAIQNGSGGGQVAIGIEDDWSAFRLNVFTRAPQVPGQDPGQNFPQIDPAVSNGGSRAGSALDLDLYLTKLILRKHGGDIWYEASNRGSNFVFTIPRN